ncbi:MAG: alpha-hydroxy-acid oxidizing protein [Chromatiales bacterium]|nr:alpha-hydroxy-acid oxidizing protein [Chromatiales bacterium]
MHRRALLRFLLGSPLLGAPWAGVLARPELAVPGSVGEALDVAQIEGVARRELSAAAWHFVVNGSDGGRTAEANLAAFAEWQIRVRRLVDVREVDTGLELFGQRLPSPLVLAPAGGQMALHPEAELATARAAGRRGHLAMMSTVSNFPIGEIVRAGGGPTWFQLYASPDPGVNRMLLAAAADAGCTAIVLTVDSPTRGNRLAERWFGQRSGDAPPAPLGNFVGWPGRPQVGDPALEWGFLDWLRAESRLPLLLKGIVTAEDARLALEHGVDGLIVSNHGGRQEDSGLATLDCLPEVVEAVDGGMPVLVDGGIRRGSDMFTALALGATAVCIGRPYLWGLGAFGEAGVARVLELLDAELVRIMQFAGVTALDGIGRGMLRRRG